jgi:hypothetical protein
VWTLSAGARCELKLLLPVCPNAQPGQEQDRVAESCRQGAPRVVWTLSAEGSFPQETWTLSAKVWALSAGPNFHPKQDQRFGDLSRGLYQPYNKNK